MMNKQQRTTNGKPRARRAISLLEVMISIGVVGIGLLGVASLIPLAHYKAAKGVLEDRKALFGKRAFRDYYVMDIPSRVVYVIPADGGFDPTVRTSYLIDPLLLSQMNRAVGTFPNDTRLAQSPVGQLLPRRLAIDLPLLDPVDPIRRQQRQASVEQIFRMSDDLVVEEPKSPQEILRQSYVFSPNNLQTVKPYSTGAYSWMATLSPDSLNRPASRTYTLSIVVFHQRQLNLPRQEIFYSVTGDLSGPAKVVYLQESLQQTLPVQGDSSERAPRAGDWIAIVRLVPAGTTGVSELKWYRIVAADNVEQTAGNSNTIHELTLIGPDWIAAPTGPPGGVFAIYVKNVASVYDKTIELN